MRYETILDIAAIDKTGGLTRSPNTSVAGFDGLFIVEDYVPISDVSWDRLENLI